ncbi:MAG: hypothetical protein K9J37_07920 [Saprospiraceae bacterium]|nr:hypothetical protein [Saprospiraceae bacterium]MCF8249825.1 hypothetical protein [Saprospiraceae bacterium]MCF8279505.1 hypothetical protein [Bacteroidales bacterium]MCF8311741.1 hypothetical protein [Saprospiraceae bacterium]MCF8440308.1 hypothetical protein [Saprospiraceae bacterium]
MSKVFTRQAYFFPVSNGSCSGPYRNEVPITGSESRILVDEPFIASSGFMPGGTSTMLSSYNVGMLKSEFECHWKSTSVLPPNDGMVEPQTGATSVGGLFLRSKLALQLLGESATSGRS